MELYSPYIIGSSGRFRGVDDLEAEEGKFFFLSQRGRGEKFYDDPVFSFLVSELGYIGDGGWRLIEAGVFKDFELGKGGGGGER